MENHCERVQMSLPWLINGTLEAAQRVDVYKHLSVCQVCREEVAFYLALQEALATEPKQRPAVTVEETQQLFQAILHSIDKTQIRERAGVMQLQPSRRNHQVLAVIRDKFRNEWDSVREQIQPAWDELQIFARIVRKLTNLAG